MIQQTHTGFFYDDRDNQRPIKWLADGSEEGEKNRRCRWRKLIASHQNK